MDESTITNIGSPNGINKLLNTANDMDDYLTSCRNNCVEKPVSVHTSIRVASEY